MKVFLIVSFLIFGVYSDQLDIDESSDELHSSTSHWIAKENFISQDKIGISSLLAVHSSIKGLPLRKFTHKEKKLEIPKNYNAVDAYPKCKSISVIKMQSNCGSCWALSVAAALSDRFCIATDGEINVQLSAEEILTCCTKCGQGCNGGSPAKAWSFTKQKGIVTGGDYGSNEGCQPYAIEPCSMETNKKCGKDVAKTPKCKRNSCTNGNYQTPFQKDIHKSSKVYRLSDDIEDIQREILANGPVVTSFDVYEDFLNYSRGIYRLRETSGQKLGEHTVKIVGWGTCKMCGMKYWIASNTWGESWGEKGFFKVMRETNNVGFEKNVSAGLPKIHKKKH